MTIDSVDILADYGLKLLNAENLYDFPARKKTSEVQGIEAKDIVFQPQIVTLLLKGVYASKAVLISQLKAFETLLKSSLKHAVVITAHNVWFTATAADGFEVKAYWQFNAAVIKLKLTIVQD
jgi:hypothetical protein